MTPIQTTSQWIMDKWDLAPGEDKRLGGKLAHDIVMQHETKEIIDQLIYDIKNGKRMTMERNKMVRHRQETNSETEGCRPYSFSEARSNSKSS